MNRYETRDSPVSTHTWVTWDTMANWFVYGSRDYNSVVAHTDSLNQPQPTVPPSTEPTHG